jgi:hypothetical protein
VGWAWDNTLGEEADRTLGARFVRLDVTDDASVEAAAAWSNRQTALQIPYDHAALTIRSVELSSDGTV